MITDDSDSDYLDFNLTLEQWTAVLKLSTLWSFSSVRALAIRHLGPLLVDNPFERLMVARTHGVNDWAKDAVQSLIEHKDPLNEMQVARLTPADVVMVAMGRETLAKSRALADPHRNPAATRALEKEETCRGGMMVTEEQHTPRCRACEDRERKQLKVDEEVHRRETHLQREGAERQATAERRASEVVARKAEAERTFTEAMERKMKGRRELNALGDTSRPRASTPRVPADGGWGVPSGYGRSRSTGNGWSTSSGGGQWAWGSGNGHGGDWPTSSGNGQGDSGWDTASPSGWN